MSKHTMITEDDDKEEEEIEDNIKSDNNNPINKEETTPLIQPPIENSQNPQMVQVPQNAKEMSHRYIVYILLVISNIFITVDHGTIPASTWNLYQIFHSNQQIGLFGSLVFIGNTFGSLVFYFLIDKNRKTLLIFSMMGLTICLITFILTTNIPFLLTNRLILGIFQSYVIIYLPLWCNQFGISRKKGIMISLVQLTVPAGVFLGYLSASLFISYDSLDGWKYTFIIQSIVVFLMSLTFFAVDNDYFDKNLLPFHREEEQKDNNETVFYDHPNKQKKPISCAAIKAIFSNKIYTVAVLALSVLYFSITGLQYWGSDYMNRVLEIHSPKERLLYFTIICFSSPTIGVLLGGKIVDNCGGFTNKRSYLVCFILASLSAVNGIIVPFVSSINYFILFTWFALLYGGATMPILTGIVICSLDTEIQAQGNSITLFFGNLLGYLPSPYIYGAIQDLFEDGGKKSLLFNMAYSFVAVFLLAIMTKLKYDKND